MTTEGMNFRYGENVSHLWTKLFLDIWSPHIHVRRSARLSAP